MAILSLKSLSDKIGSAALGTTATTLIGAINEVDSDLSSAKTTLSDHVASTSNPHSITKAQIGLGNVDNTSDANKPISSATQTALNLKLNSSDFTAANVKSRLLTVDGSGSNIDACLLDGYHGSSYLRVGATTNGQTVTIFGGATAPKLYLQANAGVSGAALSFMNDAGTVDSKIERRDGATDKRLMFENNNGYNLSFWDDGTFSRWTPEKGMQQIVDLGMYGDLYKDGSELFGRPNTDTDGIMLETSQTLPSGYTIKTGYWYVNTNTMRTKTFATAFPNRLVWASVGNMKHPTLYGWNNQGFICGGWKGNIQISNPGTEALFSWIAIGY